MTRLRRRTGDDGNIVFALLGIMMLTFIVLIGFTQVILGEKQSRHDRAFEQALAAAESGLDQLLTEAKASPLATSLTPISGSDAANKTSWTATATGGSGHWTLTAVGRSDGAIRPITRTITQQVDIGALLSYPLFGTTSVTIGGDGSASGIDTYDSSMSSAVCAANGSASSMLAVGTRMCTHASPAVGRIGTDGPLTMAGASLPNMGGVDIYNTGVAGYTNPLATGRCVGDATACNAVGSSIVTHEDKLDFPLSSQCANGIGAGATAYDGSLALAANAVYSFTNVTLNATAVANLANLSGSTLVICFSGTLNVVPTVPINSTVSLTPRAPSTLILISTSGSPTVRLNAGLGLSTKLSAVVYAPNATCSATAHVDLYGAMVCGSVSAPDGINVHYDTQVGNIPFDRPVMVSAWREQ
jgi:hypothetical protein